MLCLMTTMIAEVYDAFTDAGASKEKAEAASKAVAQQSDRDISEVKLDLHLLKWMIGFNLAFTMALLWKVFSQWG